MLRVVGVYVRAIYFTPIEALQGAAQKIYYLHVPAALGAYIAVSITALASIVFLWLHDERADRLAEASAEVGLVFLTVVLTTGPIWGHAASGARGGRGGTCASRSRCFSGSSIVAYLVLRGAIEDRRDARALLGGARHARRAADSVHPSQRLLFRGASASDADRAASRASRRCRRRC